MSFLPAARGLDEWTSGFAAVFILVQCHSAGPGSPKPNSQKQHSYKREAWNEDDEKREKKGKKKISRARGAVRLCPCGLQPQMKGIESIDCETPETRGAAVRHPTPMRIF